MKTNSLRARRLRLPPLVLLLTAICGFLPHPVPGQSLKPSVDWARRVIPLPKKMSVIDVASVKADEVFLTVPRLNDPVVETAGRILRRLAKGVRGFQIRLTLTDGTCPDKVRQAIRDVPNNDQAYAIEPLVERSRADGPAVGG